MKDKERKPQDKTWVDNKEQNHHLNESLRDGFVGGHMYRRLISARRIINRFFRHQEPLKPTDSSNLTLLEKQLKEYKDHES